MSHKKKEHQSSLFRRFRLYYLEMSLMLTKQTVGKAFISSLWKYEIRSWKKKEGRNFNGFAGINVLILSSQWSMQKIHMQIKTTWFYLTTISFVQIKSCKWVWPVFIPFDDVLQFLYNKVEGKAVKLLGKEVFIIEPFKVRGFIVTQQQKHLKCKSIIFDLLLLLFFF